MLTSLHIENIAIIKQLDLDFSNGFSVMTGETGAGKSIIIDALSLLCGARSGRDAIRSEERMATVQAVFEHCPKQVLQLIADADCGQIDDDTVMLSRTVYLEGKNSVKCNGRSISVALLRDIAAGLLQIHGQNDNLLFLAQENHLAFLDDYAQLTTQCNAYREKYEQLCAIKTKINAHNRDEKENARRADLLRYQISEIDAVKPKVGEEEELLSEKTKIQNAEKIEQCFEVVRNAWMPTQEEDICTLLGQAETSITQLLEVYPSLSGELQRLGACRIELEDIMQSVLALDEGESEVPSQQRLDEIEARLGEFARLKKKYGADISQVLAFREQCEQQLQSMQLGETDIKQLKQQYKEIGTQALAMAKQLTQARVKYGKILSEEMMRELAYLDMEKVRFSVLVEPDCDEKGHPIFNANGTDRVQFLISTNPGEPLKPIDKVASGGELSRVMLAAKCVLNKEDSRTMIFDEVDTGVSGKTSQKIGLKMKQLSQQGCQVLCVTHAAQIAALADAHYLISKKEEDGRTTTQVQLLDESGRIEELSRILGGIHITNSVRQTAKEMLHTVAPTSK